MSISEKNTSFFEEDKAIDVRQVVLQYLGYWPWFILSVLLSVGGAFLYLKYTNVIYATTAKVRILDNKEAEDFSLDVSRLLSTSSINLENEIAAFNSYRLSEQVVRNLGIHISYVEIGAIQTTPVYAPPFKVRYINDIDGLAAPIAFTVTLTEEGFEISVDSEVVAKLAGHEEHLFSVFKKKFSIDMSDTKKDTYGMFGTKKDSYKNRPEFNVLLQPITDVAIALTKEVNVRLNGEDSDVLQVQIKSTDKVYAQKVINNLIMVYANDGVLDRQQVSLRTIEFVDERFLYLRTELDSIEQRKKSFKELNSLSFIEGDVRASIQKRVVVNNELKSLETQLLLAELLEEALSEQADNRLLPSNLGLNNLAVNQLITQYNTLLLTFEKVGTSAGENNPTYRLMQDEMLNLKRNISASVNSFVNQLKDARNKAQSRQARAAVDFRDIPEKEQILRRIEREQNLKENLYLLLLQKREEAAINLAVTVPNIKIIDYAITDQTPIAPKRRIILFGALGLGLFIPFVVLYLRIVLDTKINSRDDIEHSHLDIPLVGEIPFTEPKAIITGPMDRSVMAEAFRITGSNINYKLGQGDDERAKVIFITSSITGEGKTFTATNLALSYAFLNKRVMLVGADLRNPGIHKYFGLTKSEKGMSDYLTNPNMKWRDCVCKPMPNAPCFDLILSGSVSLNPALLLANNRFDNLINSLAEHYDYIVVDTAPTLLVSDTHMISENADLIVYILRAGVTDKGILEYIRGLKKEEKLKNITFVLNSVSKQFKYAYGYEYGYGAAQEKQGPWYSGIISKMGKTMSSLF